MEETQKGILIVLEGIDGAGKTTQAERLRRYLLETGNPVTLSKEPTSGRYGQILRESAREGRLTLEQELDLFIRDREEHVRSLILPGLDRGDIVILDRYYFSTAAYQGARGVDVNRIIELNSFAPKPDLVLFLDVSPSTGLTRISARGDVSNHFEIEDTLSKSAAIFRGMDFPYFCRIDGEQDVLNVEREIKKLVLGGPLFKKMCIKAYKITQCETLNCGFWNDNTCRYKLRFLN